MFLFRPSILPLLLPGVLLLASAPRGFAQDETLGLIQIPHGVYTRPGGDSSHQPDQMYASSLGGFADITVKHSEKFTERLRVQWKFDRDVRSLRSGDEVGFTLRAGFLEEGNESDDPYKASYGHRAKEYWLKTSAGSSMASQRELPFIKKWHPSYFSHSIHAEVRTTRELSRNASKGTHVGSFKIGKSPKEGLTGFTIELVATAYGNVKDRDTPRSAHYEWVYLFQVNERGRNVEAKIGDPEIPTGLQPKLSDSRDSRADPAGTDNSRNARRDSSDSPAPKVEVTREDDVVDNRMPRQPFDDHIIRTTPQLPKDLPADVARGTILQANRVRVREGDTVRVRVDLWNARNISNMNFVMKYDGSVAVPIENPVRGSLLANIRLEANPDDRSGVLVGFADEAGISGTGSVVYVPYKAMGRAGERTDVTLQITTVNDPSGGEPDVYEIPGEILIVDENGFLPGDTTGDGVVNELDARDALRMSVKLIPVQWQADVDENGEVTSRDATLIMQRIREGN